MGVDNMPERIFNSLMPYTMRRVEQIKLEAVQKNTRFVHYTSADSLLKIIQNREVWLRNSSVMNDYSEVEYGDRLLIEVWNSDLGQGFKSLLDEHYAGLSTAVAEYHDGWAPTYMSETYLFSVSEHTNSDDEHGRLSMWREYARNDGVALVLSPAPFQSETQLLQAYTVPVMYANRADFERHFEEMLEGLSSISDHLRQMSFNSIRDAVFQALRFLVVSTKHPAFKEEREWRIIYQPSLAASSFIDKKIVSLGGVPQHVCALELDLLPGESEKLDLRPKSIVERILIGPTRNEGVLTTSIVDALGQAEIENPAELVMSAQIPLRL